MAIIMGKVSEYVSPWRGFPPDKLLNRHFVPEKPGNKVIFLQREALFSSLMGATFASEAMFSFPTMFLCPKSDRLLDRRG